jgi:hypothetical protein
MRPVPVLCTGRTAQAVQRRPRGAWACLVGLGLVTVLAAPIFVIQPIIERAILETVLPDLRYL